MLEDIKAEDVASFITAASAAKKAGKKKFSIGGKSYPVTIGKALEQRVAEMTEDDIIELNDKKKSKYLTAMKARLNKEDTGVSIAKKMMQHASMRHLAEIIAEMEIITPDELQSIVSEDLKIAARSLFLEDIVEASEEGKVRIIKTKDNTFQVQRMTKGEFVNQGKPYKSLKQAEKERSTGQSSMQFESEISWDFDGVMVRITQSDFDNLDEDMKNDTTDLETVSVDGVHMPVLFVAEVRQMKNKKTETMVQKNGKVKVIDKKDEKKFLDMGYTLAECMELQIEAATPEKIMKDIAALEKMISKIGGNSSAVKMKKVALERKIAKLEAELEDMDEETQESYSNYKKKLKEYGYGPAKKKKKTEELDEAPRGNSGPVTVNKKKYSWGNMITVNHGTSVSYPLHPKQQLKIKNLKDGESINFTDETGEKVAAKRVGDKVHLRQSGVNAKTTVDYKHFNETYGKKKMKEAMEKGMPPGEHVFGKEVDGKMVMVHKLEKTGNFCAYVDGKKIGEYDDLKAAKSAAMDSMKEAMEKGMPAGEHVFDKKVDGKEIMVHKLDKSGKFCAYVDGDKIGEYDDLAAAKKAAMDSLNETYGKMNAKKLTWKDYEKQGNDAWMSRVKRKDNPYKKNGPNALARTSWFDGWDNMKMDSDAGDFDESYGKMNASKMSSKEKAKNRALSKADREAQPKGKVSLKPMPASLAKKMKEDFVKQMNIIVEGGEMEQSIEESMSPKQIDALKKSYESLRGKKIDAKNGMKISRTLEKLDQDSLVDLMNSDIPFVSTLAVNKLMMNHGMSAAEINKSRNESVDEGFMDKMKQLVPGAKGKPAQKLQKKVKKSDNAEQTKVAAEINRKLKLIDGLMKKVGPLGGQLGRLMAFRRLPLAKMTPKGMYIALNAWYHSVEDELDYGDDSVDLKKKYQRSVEDLYELWEEVGFRLSDYMWASGYDIKGIGQMAKIGFPAKKRTDPEWLKMNESVEKDLGESAGDMEAAAAELEAYAKKSGGMDKNTFMRVATLLKTGHPDKLKSYINNMDTDPREYVAMLLKKHVGKKSAEKMMDIKFRGESISWEDAETLRAAGVKLDETSGSMKKPVSKMTDKEKSDNAAKRKEYNAYQKSKRNEEISGSGYELYHKTLGSAIDTAITQAKLQYGIDITPDERMEVVGMGPRKPSNGKTNTYRLMGNKGKAIQVQVYNRGGSRPYELNMYKE